MQIEYFPEPEERQVLATCEECQEEIFAGEPVYSINNRLYCENCVEKTTIEDFLEVG